jgi:hypothetical protein
VIRADQIIEVPDYTDQRPHGMIGVRATWSLDKGDRLWVPNDTQWGSEMAEGNRFEGLVFEVAWSRPVTPGGGEWEVVAFGATMLRLQGLDAFEFLPVLLPHVPAICPTCKGMFDQARRSAGLNTEEG